MPSEIDALGLGYALGQLEIEQLDVQVQSKRPKWVEVAVPAVFQPENQSETTTAPSDDDSGSTKQALKIGALVIGVGLLGVALYKWSR